ELLRVNLDPQAPEFYDYTTAEWYAAGEPRLAGPIVDYACTNEYAITLSVPVHSSERFFGVAAADVLVASLETRVVPALAGLGRPAALTSAAGGVSAASDAGRVPGQRLDTRKSASAPVPSWRLVDL